MKKIYVLFTKTLILLLMANLAIGNNVEIPLPQEEVCNSTADSWVDNITPNSFDLHWLPVPAAIGYQVDVFVNNVSVFSSFTTNEDENIPLQMPLNPCDRVDYEITTYCANGSTSLPHKGGFNYADGIGIVDIVMGLKPGDKVKCKKDCSSIILIDENNPNFDRYKNMKKEELYACLNENSNYFSIYDCDCVNNENQLPNGGDKKKCRTTCSKKIEPCKKKDNQNINNNPILNTSGYFFPNPFSNQAQANFEILESGEVNLSILDFSGKEVLSLIRNETYEAGEISVSFDGSDLEKGMYYYVFTIGGRHEVGRIVKF